MSRQERTITKEQFEKHMGIVPFIISIVGLIIVIALAILGIYLILQI